MVALALLASSAAACLPLLDHHIFHGAVQCNYPWRGLTPFYVSQKFTRCRRGCLSACFLARRVEEGVVMRVDKSFLKYG